MMKFFRKKLNKKGFTLVELLLVIAVLGIIAAISIPRVVGSSDAIKVRADEEAAAMIISKVETMIMTNEIILDTNATVGVEATDKPVIDYIEALPEVQSAEYGAQTNADVVITINDDGDVIITVTGNLTTATSTKDPKNEIASKTTEARNF